MAKILVVDDNATNRKLVVSTLEFEGYEVAEAVDGGDGLRAARIERPQLVISDILMPSMDGYEFVRQLRTDPQLQRTAVIFYTAHYLEREARKLAEECQVTRVIVKANGTAELLEAIRDVLAGAAPPESRPISAGFDREHLQLITDKLAQNSSDLSISNARFEALAELNIQFASERDPRMLLEQVCHGARCLLAASYAVLAVADGGRGEAAMFCVSGVDLGGHPAARPRVDSGLFAEVVAERRARRVANGGGASLDVGLPAAYPRARTVLIAPLMSLTRTFGWICLADKVGADAFTAEDEHILAFLSAQAGRIYENGSLYREVQQYAAALVVEIEERKQAAAKIEHLNRVHALLSGINSLIVRVGGRDELFAEACRLATEHGRFKVAWCGWLEPTSAQLVPVASSGEGSDLVTRASLSSAPGMESLVLASMRLRQPVVCNDLQDESSHRVGCSTEMLQRGYRSIVALPLIIATRSVGCLALISDEPNFFDEKEMLLLKDLSGDISFALDHIAKSEQLNYLAYYDALTGLANRTLFQERLAQSVSAATRSQSMFAVVIAEPERFDTVNETFGRHARDELLRKLAERLTACIGSAADVGRNETDQFFIIIPGVLEVADIVRTLEEWWRKWLGPPFEVADQEIRIAAKAGIALYPNDGIEPEMLLKNAEAALKNGKTTGRQYMFFTRSLTERVAESLALENELRRALEREEFVLHYQPKVDLVTRRLTGVEALIRWQSPERGLVPPAKFISLLEETGLIVDVGAWALRQASLDRARWLARRLQTPRIAVNVSTVQLRRESFVRVVSNLLKIAGSEAGLDIEVTESLFMDDASGNIDKLSAIRELGIGIAIDDFGTGYSSLGYLTRLPAQTLKIDRSFIAAMLDDPRAMTLVSTIISMAHALNLGVVAEGVESEEQARTLRLLRCDQMQGYLISKPLPFDDMTNYLAQVRT
jgi:diguanylate cyclase (GGDEF)-like protein